MNKKLSLSKLAGTISTTALIAANVAPNTLHIPMPIRPWIFILAIAWILLLTSGVFS